MSRRRFDDLPVAGLVAGPREDMAFAEPWNARAFALVVALADRGLFTLKEFQGELIASVREHEKTGCIDSEDVYYTRWVEALTAILLRKDLVTPSGINAAEAALIAAAAETREHQHSVSRRSDGSLRVEPVTVA